MKRPPLLLMDLVDWKRRLATWRASGRYLSLAEEALEALIEEVQSHRAAAREVAGAGAQGPGAQGPGDASYEHAQELLHASAAEHARLVAEGLPPLKPHEVLEPFRLAGCLFERDET